MKILIPSAVTLLKLRGSGGEPASTASSLEQLAQLPVVLIIIVIVSVFWRIYFLASGVISTLIIFSPPVLI